MTRTFLVLAFLGVAATSAAAQFPEAGKLNTWTTRKVARQHHLTEVTYVRSVRVGSQQNFDRVTFEFTRAIPNYNIVYLRSRYYEDEGGTQRIGIAGSAFVNVTLNQISGDDEQYRLLQLKDFIPKGKLKFASLQELEDAGLFEGFYEFLLGIRGRKAFRVSELSDPARLVIDFKH